MDELSSSQHSGVEHRECPPGLYWGRVQHPADVPHLIQLRYAYTTNHNYAWQLCKWLIAYNYHHSINQPVYRKISAFYILVLNVEMFFFFFNIACHYGDNDFIAQTPNFIACSDVVHMTCDTRYKFSCDLLPLALLLMLCTRNNTETHDIFWCSFVLRR